VSVRWYVGGNWGQAPAETVDLGNVEPADAARFLLDVAVDTLSSAREGALGAAALANGADVTRLLTEIVNDRRRPVSVRQWAITVLPRGGKRSWSDGIVRMALDRDEPLPIRETAASMFSANEPGWERDALIRIAKTADAPSVQRVAVQRLSRVKDPSVLTALEELIGRQ
jgi:hypothetical protein